MKRQSILFILLLLLTLFICCGCGSSESAEPETSAAPMEAAAPIPEEAAPEEAPADDIAVDTADASVDVATAEYAEEGQAAYSGTEELEEEIIASQKAANSLEKVEDISGIFEGLEDNHTALFSFDGAETTFYFEDPAVQNVLNEAVIGSTYILSYNYDDSLGLNVIYEISE